MAITTSYTKVCTGCGVEKPISSFNMANTKTGQRHTKCRACRTAVARASRERNPVEYKERASAAAKRWALKNPAYRQRYYAKYTFGVTSEVLQAHVKEQIELHGTRCQICGKEAVVVGMVKSSSRTRLVLDHNHTTGKLRGMLCDICNTAIGKLNDDPDLLRKAVSYLEAWL